MNHSGANSSLLSHDVTSSDVTAMYNTLYAALGNYKRHFDLFNSVHFSKNPEKRILAAKRYALLQACNQLVEENGYMLKSVFEVYKGFEEASTKNYNYFSKKLREFKANAIESCTHKRINSEYKASYKLNPYVEHLIYTYLCDPAYHSYESIKGWVNTSILQFNEKHGALFGTISKSTVAQYYLDHRNEINYYRKGKKRFDIETRPYLPRITAKNAGSLYQMDGTPIQIFCWNKESEWAEKGKQKIRLNLFVIRDAYSCKITGFDMSETEDRYNIIEALKMAVNTHGHLPAELVSDNFSSSKTDEYQALKSYMENRGVIVRAAKVGNAQDKGEVERFFGTFQSKFQRLIDGYIGEGIRSKRDNGRIAEEFITKCAKENGLYSYDEMMKIIAELVVIYNNSELGTKYNAKTPNALYDESEKPYVKGVDGLEFAKMFWLNKKIKVRKSMIINEVRKSKRFYEIWDNELKLKLNGETVQIYYEQDDASTIHVYSLDGEFICTCEQHVQIHEAQVDQLENEKERMMKHVAHRDSLDNNINKKADKRAAKAKQFVGSEFDITTPLQMEKHKLNGAENEALLKHFYDRKEINPDKIKEREPVGATYNKEPKAKKKKGIHTKPATYKPL